MQNSEVILVTGLSNQQFLERYAGVGRVGLSGGVSLIDKAIARAQREAIASTIRQPVRMLVSSTFHDNYSKGNVAYADVLSSILPTSSCLSTTGTASTGCAH